MLLSISAGYSVPPYEKSYNGMMVNKVVLEILIVSIVTDLQWFIKVKGKNSKNRLGINSKAIV